MQREADCNKGVEIWGKVQISSEYIEFKVPKWHPNVKCLEIIVRGTIYRLFVCWPISCVYHYCTQSSQLYYVPSGQSILFWALGNGMRQSKR